VTTQQERYDQPIIDNPQPRLTIRQPADRLRAEAQVDQSHPVEVSLGEYMVTVIPLRKWRSSAIRALRSGDYDTWASKSLTPDSWTLWQQIDPTLDDIEALFADWQQKTGQSTPESFASPH
jgi:hypothetical protein